MIRLVLTALLSLVAGNAIAQARLVEWVEDAPLADDTKIALGYPVPVPVDTPLPFHGFRSYEGLHMRHQDLALTTPWVHGSVVGSTTKGRSVWAYQLGDADLETAYGLPEQAMLSNGGIHAREWQSPEVVTGIIELLALAEDDFLVDYLRENANVLVIPVLNVDGFLQTQRYPGLNWIGEDPRNPDTWPRDGRMRRKNMRGADEVLSTRDDHLGGVDLNRNNEPYWATSSASSIDLDELVYHGEGAASEPETRALDAAAQLGPATQLSMYTDIHSYSQVHFWDRNGNERLSRLTDRLLDTFTQHHQGFPAAKYYWYERWWNIPQDQGIGTTAEYFTHSYQVPSWTLEVEPSGGDHPGLPGAGADYGGLGRNSHDGFILPESEVERVRTQLAETFAVAYYQQSGPPSIRSVQFTDIKTGAVVFDAEWDTSDATTRTLHAFQPQALQFDRDYRVWIAWDKPMRWRVNGEVAPLPGQGVDTLDVEADLLLGGTPLIAHAADPAWLDTPGLGPGGYLRYRDDALAITAIIPSSENQARVDRTALLTLSIGTRDMTGNGSDADPATVARWADGSWQDYEDDNGDPRSLTGGNDATIGIEVTSETLGDPFVIQPGTSAAWFDIERNGEGFLLEILSGNRAVMYWFTYGPEGQQDWYMAEGEVRGNRIVFPEMVSVSGGVFGPGFDPEQVVRTPVGSASFIWSSCDSGEMSWVIDADGGPRRQGRMDVYRLTHLMGLQCEANGVPSPAENTPLPEASRLSGSWYDPSHSGEGYVLEVLADHRVLVYWFSYDADGKRRWFFGTGEIVGQQLVFDVLHTTLGGVFGPGFDPEAVEIVPWGTLELELGCTSGTARFTSTETGFPAGELDLQRLSTLDGLACTE